MKVEISAKAEKQLRRLPQPAASRILRKIAFYASAADPLASAVSLQNRPGPYRWRIGVYRAIFRAEGKVLYVLTVGHRKDIYDR